MVTRSQLDTILDYHYPDSKTHKMLYCSWGLINENCIIELDDSQVDIRIYPRDGWKARKEEYLYDLVRKKTAVPVPSVLAVDDSLKVINKAYMLQSVVQGETRVPVRSLSTNLVKSLGKTLAQIHTIPLKHHGWIVGTKIKPAFSRWSSFISYDFSSKMRSIRASSVSEQIKSKITRVYKENRKLANISSKPCLLHKDFHMQNIFIHKNKINGVIDWEWAIGGHNEFDISKSIHFMFERLPKQRKAFLSGYEQVGTISKEFDEREQFYHFLTLVNKLSLALRLKNKKLQKESVAQIKSFK